MKLPCLPLSIDSFGGPATRPSPHSPLFLLSHFHTDHMKGLSDSWCGGLIVCTEMTRALVLQRFGSDLAERIIGVPLWRRTLLLQSISAVLGHGGSSQSSLSPSASPQSEAVFVTLIPAFHIPGSVMFYLETPFGKLLYTGDFKFEEGTLAPTVLRAFFATHPVDHVYIDDTWLHLGVEVDTPPEPTHAHDSARLYGEETTGAGGEVEDDEDLFRVFDAPHSAAVPEAGASASHASSGPPPLLSGAKVLSKLLNREQTAEAIEAIGRRMDYQRQQFARDTARIPTAGTSTTSTQPPLRIFPYKIRVYLHNQFGKELLIQQLAVRLGTRALIDDERYARLSLVAAQLKAPTETDMAVVSDGERNATMSPHQAAAHLWAAQGGEAAQYPLQLDCFISYSQYRGLLEAFDANSDGARLCPADVVRLRLPLIEVVGSRAKISDAALEEAMLASGGAPFYGVVISGWARLQRRRGAPERIWQVPTTLHCAPDETIAFVALLRPLSITPLHYRPSRAAVILQRLGPLLRTPFVNHYLQPAGGTSATVEWVTPLAPPLDVTGDAAHRLDLVTAPHEEELGLGKRKGFRLRTCTDTAGPGQLAAGVRDVGDDVVPPWRLDALVQSLSVRHKRPREASASPCFSLDTLADMLDSTAEHVAQDARQPSLPANTIIL